jgi:hypothetical protein
MKVFVYCPPLLYSNKLIHRQYRSINNRCNTRIQGVYAIIHTHRRSIVKLDDLL